MIAATAEVHGLIVVTRNVRDFVGLGVRTLNPFRQTREIDDGAWACASTRSTSRCRRFRAHRPGAR